MRRRDRATELQLNINGTLYLDVHHLPYSEQARLVSEQVVSASLERG